MKNYIYIFFVLVLGFVSCDGRTSSSKALSESIEDFKAQTSLKELHFIPETAIQKTVDSTLSNGFRVKLKVVTDLDNSVKISSQKDTVNHITTYRNFKFSILVEKEGKLIFSDSFDKSKVNKLLGFSDDLKANEPFYDFHKKSVLKYIELYDKPSLETEVLINIGYAIPQSRLYSEQTLRIKEDGTLDIVYLNY
ncbi:hypothetical protein BTO05_03310 [Winogradskyella sp. PC-19]|uniref:hypothetical protein n=1 Tax=unclassified Winogradskyella TaxID=2615021 RepID=UPI000B3CF8AC|nr:MULTISPECIES: hypothetical protein [unclassified Winogradskyella]ARV08711.1 hypothetical protein BTO05_03310 [Winogradskyella sp. PC-19]